MNRKLSNYLEIANLDKPIYRIFPVNRFFEMIKEKKMAMVKPKLWDDPFENLLLSSRFQLDDGEIVNFESANSVYGQCWTEHRESMRCGGFIHHKKMEYALVQLLGSCYRH